MTPRRSIFVLAILLLLLGIHSQICGAEPGRRYRLLLAEYGNTGNRLVEIGPTGQVEWDHRPPSIAVIFEVLTNRHILYAYGGKPTGVREINRDQKVVWDWVSGCPQVLGASRLPNGNVLVGEQGPCQAVEIDALGHKVRTIPLSTTEPGFHRQVRNLHGLLNGHVLAAHEGEGAVREVDSAGALVWEFKGGKDVFDALRLENGNTLISCGTQARVIEVSPKGEIVWEFQASDAPELNLVWVTSLQRLRNGNLLVGNFLRGHEGKGAHAFEVTREKKVVWKYAEHALVKSITTARILEEE